MHFTRAYHVIMALSHTNDLTLPATPDLLTHIDRLKIRFGRIKGRVKNFAAGKRIGWDLITVGAYV